MHANNAETAGSTELVVAGGCMASGARDAERRGGAGDLVVDVQGQVAAEAIVGFAPTSQLAGVCWTMFVVCALRAACWMVDGGWSVMLG